MAGVYWRHVPPRLVRGQAMVGSISSDTPEWTCDVQTRSKNSYEIADAMLAERRKGGAK